MLVIGVESRSYCGGASGLCIVPCLESHVFGKSDVVVGVGEIIGAIRDTMVNIELTAFSTAVVLIEEVRFRG